MALSSLGFFCLWLCLLSIAYTYIDFGKHLKVGWLPGFRQHNRWSKGWRRQGILTANIKEKADGWSNKEFFGKTELYAEILAKPDFQNRTIEDSYYDLVWMALTKTAEKKFEAAHAVLYEEKNDGWYDSEPCGAFTRMWLWLCRVWRFHLAQ